MSLIICLQSDQVWHFYNYHLFIIKIYIFILKYFGEIKHKTSLVINKSEDFFTIWKINCFMFFYVYVFGK